MKEQKTKHQKENTVSSSYLGGVVVENLGFLQVAGMLVVLMENEYHVDTGPAHQSQEEEISQGQENEKHPSYCLAYWQEVTVPVTLTNV